MSPSLWNGHGSFICLRVCVLNYKFLWTQFPAYSPAWSPPCCSDLQGHFQFLLQKQVHVFVSPIQDEVALQNFPFYSPFKSLLLLLSSLVMLEESNLLSRISAENWLIPPTTPIHTTSFTGLCPGKAQLPKSNILPRKHNTVQPKRCKHIHSNSITIQKYSQYSHSPPSHVEDQVFAATNFPLELK